MGIDTSIYSNIQAPRPIEVPSYADAAKNAMSLSSLAMQNRQAQQTMQTNEAVKALYAKHTGADGSLDQQGFLSDLGKVSPQSAMEYQQHFAKMGKEGADAQSAKLEAAQKTLGLTGPAFDAMAKMPDDQRAAAYPQVIQQLKSQGVDVSRMDHPYNPDAFTQYYGAWRQNKQSLENQVAQSTIAKNQSETAMAPAKLGAELYGSRSPNAELTSQFNNEPAIKSAKSSQVAMNQMLDNFKNRSPQGDASLLLNAYKIKFPDKPDVNSIEELKKAESVPEQWKQALNHRINGLLPDEVVNDLMRDGVSTYRANADSAKPVQEHYQNRARHQNVNDTTLTGIPGVDKTYAEAMKLQDKIGPYVPPTERGGLMAGVTGAVSKALGSSGEKTAAAQEKPAPQFREAGAKVSADEVAQYATRHKMKLSDAQTFLKGQGYAIDR